MFYYRRRIRLAACRGLRNLRSMSSTRVLWGQICAALGIVLVTMWAATQWVAWKLGFQPRLGPPWFVLIGGLPVYYPPAFFWWWLVYDAYAPKIFMQGACIAASGGILSMVVAFVMSIWRAREARTAATYGSARWATASEVRDRAADWARTVSCSADSGAITCAIMDRSTCFVLRRRARARALVSSFRPF